MDVAGTLFDLSGRKAICAGGAGDLGCGMAAALRDAGADVVILDVAEGTPQIAGELERAGNTRVAGVQVDLTSRQALRAGFAQAFEILGTVDVLVNSQGIQRWYPAEEYPLDEWDAIIELNLTSVFELCQLAGRVMLAKGYGKIVNIASLISFTGGVTISGYAASKGGVAQITKSFSNEWAGRGITVNAIAPGYMDTRMTQTLINDPIRNAQILSRIPRERWGRPEDLAGPVLFLASSASDYVTGHVLPVDGGWLGR
jgi:2-deoxy-D-gluconate 3-dehydrogenase